MFCGGRIHFGDQRNGYFSLLIGFMVWQPHGAVTYKHQSMQSLWSFSLQQPTRWVSIPGDRYGRGFHPYVYEREHMHIYHRVYYGWVILAVPHDYIKQQGSLVSIWQNIKYLSDRGGENLYFWSGVNPFTEYSFFNPKIKFIITSYRGDSRRRQYTQFWLMYCRSRHQTNTSLVLFSANKYQV